MKIVYAIILSACFVGAENKTEFYKPIVKDVEGWRIAVEPRLLADDNKALADKCLVALANHLQRIKYILPGKKVEAATKASDPLGAPQRTIELDAVSSECELVACQPA